MALVIEDGTLVAGANSFATRAEIIAYAAARGVTLADDETTDFLAVQAIDYIWSRCLKGDLVDETQTTPFPRSGLVSGDTVEGYEYSIPPAIKMAQLQLALDAGNGITLTASANPAAVLKRSKVGPLEREFFEPLSLTLDGTPPLAVANKWLSSYVCDGGGFALKTVRA